jgi:hypothetical protein
VIAFPVKRLQIRSNHGPLVGLFSFKSDRLRQGKRKLRCPASFESLDKKAPSKPSRYMTARATEELSARSGSFSSRRRYEVGEVVLAAPILDDSELGELTAQRVGDCGALVDQQLPRRVLHQRRLLLFRLDRNEPQIWPRRRLADGARIVGVGLAARFTNGFT